MQVKDYSLKVLRLQQITDASFLFSKGLHWKMVNIVILQSILKLNETLRLLMRNIMVPKMKQNSKTPLIRTYAIKNQQATFEALVSYS